MTKQVDVLVEAGLGAQERRPFVLLAILHSVTGSAHVQMRPSEARRIGIQLLEAAAGAMADASLIEAAGGESLTTAEAAALLQRARDRRAAVEQRTGDTT